MKGNWTHGDLIDLEYFLAQDRERSQADLHDRDRHIYLDLPVQTQQATQEALLHHWLLSRRAQEFPKGNSPGQAISEAFRSFTVILMACGAFIGLASGLTFFTYSGTTPVNVLNFLFLFLFSQLLMLLFLFICAPFRLAGVAVLPAPIAGIYGTAVAWFVNRSRKLKNILPPTDGYDLSQLKGVLKKQRTVYGSVFYWPLFSLSQRVMVCFNLGLLAATFFRILTSDIAFGWQSTIQFSTDFIAKTVRTLALPWSWMVPSHHGYPSAAEIEGSRIILKDGIYHLQTQDLVSWWPFLVLSILFYGVLVRLALVVVGRIGQWQALTKLKTDRPVLIQVVNRMNTPMVKSQAAPAESNRVSPFDSEVDSSRHTKLNHGLPATEVMLLIALDISDNYPQSAWETHLAPLGFTITTIKTYGPDPDDIQTLFRGPQGSSYPEEGGIMLIMESWMPPINETLGFIKELRYAVGERPIFVGLIGQQSDQDNIVQPNQVERTIWHRKLDGLADPYLSVVAIGNPDDDT